jgi:hypothetical protein
LLVFSIKTYLPDGLKREWLESDKASMESLLPDIVATFVSAGPLLVERRKQREEEARQRQIAEQKRYEEQQRRKRDDNRWRKFVQLAQQRHDADLARAFLEAIRATDMQPETEIDGRNVREWISWAEDRLTQLDPLNHGVESIFQTLAGITEWSH